MQILTYRTFTFVLRPLTWLTKKKKKTTTSFLPKLCVSILLFFSQPFTWTQRKVLCLFYLVNLTPASTRVAGTFFSRMPHFPFTWCSFQSNIYTAGQTTADSQVSSLSTSVSMGCIQVTCQMAGRKYEPLGRWLRLIWKQKMLEIRLLPLNPARLQFTR